MAAAGGGLSRRRVGGGGVGPASGMAADLDDPPSRTASPGPASGSGGAPRTNGGPSDIEGNGSAQRRAAGAGSVAVESAAGHRIAYDPRDLTDEAETTENPKLTLMEEVLLLGLKDKQGYLSFWNDNISYTLRGCILIELALRRRIAIVRDASRRRLPVQDRLVEVIDGKMTGEVLLDEALKMIKMSEKMSVGQWVDLMSGETWNVMKIGYQLKQVRERLAKGLVDKGVLRTEKRNFLLFDMATHPVADSASKDAVLRRVLALLTSASPSVHAATFYREESLGGRPPIAFRVTRALSLVCCAFSANVLENALNHLSYDAREAAFQKADEFLNEFAQWPMAPRAGGGVGVSAAPALGEGSIVTSAYAEANAGASIPELARAIRAELAQGSENQYELIAAVLHVMSRMDSLL